MKLKVTNFQTAKDITLEINGFTVVIGKSNSGKTALLRAAEASLFNDSITGCVRHGEETATVELDMPGLHYLWEKGGDKNGYTVYTPTGTKEYSKVGFQVPPEVEGAGFREFKIEGEAKKIRPQIGEWHEPIFLLNKSGKVITEMMASVTRLDVINMSIRKCSTNLRRDRSTLKVREDDLKKLNKRTHDFDALDYLDVGDIDTLLQQITALEASLADVEGFTRRLAQVQGQLEQLAILDAVVLPTPLPATEGRAIDEVDAYLRKLVPAQRALDALSMLDGVSVPPTIPTTDLDRLRAVTKYEGRVAAAQTALSNLERLVGVEIPAPMTTEDVREIATVAGWIKSLAAYEARLDRLGTLDQVDIPSPATDDLPKAMSQVDGWIASLSRLVRDLKVARADADEAGTTLQAEQDRLHELRDQLGDCPVCGRA